MSKLGLHLRARPHLFIATATGFAAVLLWPWGGHWTTRALTGWNVAVWLYLAQTLVAMLHADHGRVRQIAALQEEGEAIVLGLAIAAAGASVAAIVVELAAAKSAAGGQAWPHLLFAAATVGGSWLLLPVLFTLTYAGVYYRNKPPGGVAFPAGEEKLWPDYVDFLYFSFTIAVASQTADVTITSRKMRRLVLVQALLSFAFNAAILALTINMAAGLF